MSAEDSDNNSTIVTISELIDNAFGDPEVNTVHHKHIQTVLYILARQLRILERRVAVQLTPLQVRAQKSSSSLSVTEVKLHTITESKKRDSKTSISTVKSRQGKHKGKGDKTDEGPSNKTTGNVALLMSDGTSAAKASSDKTSSYKTSSYEASSYKGSIDKYNTDKSLTAGKSSTADKSSTAEQSSTTDKSLSASKKFATGDDTSVTGKSSTADKISSAGKKSTAGKSSSAGKTSTEDDDTSMADKSSSADKTSSAAKKSTAGKTLTADDISIAETTITADKTSSDGIKSNTGQKSTADDESTADKTSSAGKKSTAGKTSTADDTSTADKTLIAGKTSTVGKISTADDTSTTEKTSSAGKKSTAGKLSDKKLSVDKSENLITSHGKKGSAAADTRSIDLQRYQRLLDEVEETRERELRVIRQRADSREQRDRTPTPIASMDSLEATYEKLLVVERVPAEEAKARAARGRSTTRSESGPRLSVVTQEQFQELTSTVRQLQKKLAPIGTPDFPENAELMQELRKGASLTDAMAALQLSARLEATEKTLTNLLSLVTDLASQMPGYEPTKGVVDNIQVLFGASDEKGKKEKAENKSTSGKPSQEQSQKESDLLDIDISRINSVDILVPLEPRSKPGSPEIKKIDEIITYEELEIALQNVYDNIMKQVTEKTTQSTVSAEAALKIVIKLENKIDVSLKLGNRMEILENVVSNYSEQINALDTGLSSQLTYYQEELTQMQHDLETGLETMAEILANTGGDATAVAELNAHFSDLQLDIDDAVQRQKELRNIQTSLTIDLDGLRAQIEMLRETKSDRDEVVDALRDKAGLGDLNGLISQQQFDAVRGDLEKRISTAYDKFNNQETVWQKAIDDLLRDLHEKADKIQVDSLRNEINYYLEMLRKEMKFITDIVGEPVAAALTRKLVRDGVCLSCAAPAHMKSEECTTPILPAMRPPTIGAEAPKPKEDGDHGCYQGYPVKHSIDPRAHVCHRWCGGSHTLINAPKSRAPPGVTITPFNRKVGRERGTDGKMYAVDEQIPKKPCSQCIIPDPSVASKHELENTEEDPSSLDPIAFRPNLVPLGDVTPPMGDENMLL